MEGRFYWLKLQRDFFRRPEIQVVEAMPNGKDYVLFYLKILCESVSSEGVLLFADHIPYSEDMLSTITNTNVDVVRAAVSVFSKLGLIEVLEDGALFMREVDKMTGSAANNDSANRVRRFRERQKEPKLPDVTKCNANVTENVTKDNESKSKNKSKSKSKSKSIDTMIDEYSNGDSELISALKDFVEMRKSIKKPLTERAMGMILNKLDKLGNPVDVLNQSILHNWQDVYELKDKKETKKSYETSELDDLFMKL